MERHIREKHLGVFINFNEMDNILSNLDHTEPEEYSWYGAGFAAYKGDELLQCPQIDDQEGWNEYLDGFMHAYADCVVDDTSFELALKRVLGGLLFDEIEDVFRQWDRGR